MEKSKERIEKIVNSLSSTTEEIMKYYHGRQFDFDYQGVLFEFAQRVHINYSAINALLKIYFKIPKFKFAVFTLLRPLLSDFLVQIYLFETLLPFDKNTLQSNQADFMKRYDELSNLFFKAFDSLVEAQIGKEITPFERDEYFKLEKDSYPKHFEIGKTKVKELGKGQWQPKQLAKEIKKGEFKDLANAYEQYFILSQYEHFGEKTEELMRSNYESDYELIFETSDYILRGLIFNISLLDNKSPFIERLGKIKDEFDGMNEK